MEMLRSALRGDALYKQFKLQYPQYADNYDNVWISCYKNHNFMSYMIKCSLYTLLLFLETVPCSFYPEIVKQCASHKGSINECIMNRLITNKYDTITASEDYVRLLSELVRIGVHPDVLKLDAIYSTLFFRQKKQQRHIDNIEKLIAGYKIARYVEHRAVQVKK